MTRSFFSPSFSSSLLVDLLLLFICTIVRLGKSQLLRRDGQRDRKSEKRRILGSALLYSSSLYRSRALEPRFFLCGSQQAQITRHEAHKVRLNNNTRTTVCVGMDRHCDGPRVARETWSAGETKMTCAYTPICPL